jgi:hypothetical protein
MVLVAMTKEEANVWRQSMRSPYKAYRSPFGPQYVFFDFAIVWRCAVGEWGVD